MLPQVPTIMHSCVSSTIPEASPQASMSNMPPATGVPAVNPVTAAASGVTDAAEIFGPSQRRQQPPHVGDPERLQHLRVVVARADVDQAAAGHVREFLVDLAGQPQADVVLAA